MNETYPHLPSEDESGQERLAVIQVLDALTHVPDACRAAEGLRKNPLSEWDEDSVRLVREIQTALMMESVPDYWLDEGGLASSDWDAASDLAAERGRQARILRDWLSAVEAQPVA